MSTNFEKFTKTVITNSDAPSKSECVGIYLSGHQWSGDRSELPGGFSPTDTLHVLDRVFPKVCLRFTNGFALHDLTGFFTKMKTRGFNLDNYNPFNIEQGGSSSITTSIRLSGREDPKINLKAFQVSQEKNEEIHMGSRITPSLDKEFLKKKRELEIEYSRKREAIKAAQRKATAQVEKEVETYRKNRIAQAQKKLAQLSV